MKSFVREINELSYKYLVEAGLDYTRKERGEVGFTKTDGSEPYIQQIIEEYAEAKGIKKEAAQKVFDDNFAKTKATMEKAELINATMMDNIAESTAFKMLEEIPTNDSDTKFEKRVFQELFDEVKSDFPEFYPLSNAFEPKRMEPSLWYTPDRLNKQFASIDTAACTPDAKLIFNVPFMERLIKFAKMKGIKADPDRVHGKKYVSQGGNIPDEYQYCEFVLMHEVMHYANGDFYFEKKFKLKGKIVNYLGDFITNYSLVKNGFAQLPMGLFSDEFNYDRHNSYKKMYEMIEEELNKLPPQERNQQQGQLDDMGDDMPEEGEGYDPDEGDGQQQQGQSGQSGDQQQGDPGEQGDQQQGDGQSGEQGDQGDQGDPQDGEGQSGEGGESGEQDDPQQGDGQSGGQGDQSGEPQDGEGDQSGQGGEQGDDGGDKDGESQDGDGQSGEGDEDKDGEGSGSGDGDEKPNKDNTKLSADDKERQRKAEQAAKDDIKDAEQRAKDQAEKDKTSKNIPDNIDDMYNRNNEKMDKAANDVQGREERKANAPKSGDLADMMKSKQQRGGKKSSADGNPYEVKERVYRPKMNWKKLLKKMVPSGTVREETITSPDRRSAAQTMVSISQTGSGRMKAGEREENDDKKGLCFVIDNSGSTMSKIGEMQANIMQLLKTQAGKLGNELYVMKFSTDAHFFKVDIKKKKFGRITSLEEFIKKGKIKIKYDQAMPKLFKSTYGGDTIVKPSITMAVKKLISNRFNVIVFSDSDLVTRGDNPEQMKQIFAAGKKQVALIGCSKSDFKLYVKTFGSKHQITHF